jgi:hypothetical protein
MLSELPASQLDSTAVVRLLQVALRKGWQAGPPFYADSLLGLPSTQQFSADMLQQVLHALMKFATTQSNWHTIEWLCMHHPAAQQLTSSMVEQLLLATFKWNCSYSGRNTCMEALCGLPAASHVSSDEVAQ